jgi:hypothetical protein
MEIGVENRSNGSVKKVSRNFARRKTNSGRRMQEGLSWIRLECALSPFGQYTRAGSHTATPNATYDAAQVTATTSSPNVP